MPPLKLINWYVIALIISQRIRLLIKLNHLAAVTVQMLPILPQTALLSI